MKFNLQSKLGAWALISLLCLAVVPIVGCNGATVAQDIVNWTPTIDASLTTLGSVAAGLAPQDAAIILPVVSGLVAGQNLLSAQAKVYLSNPTAPALQQLQAQALAFQSNVTDAVLNAVKVTNPASQQKVLNALNGAVTGISAILALIQTVKGNSLTPTSVTAPKVVQAMLLINQRQSVSIIANHYGISQEQALVVYGTTMSQLQAGF